MRIITKEKEEKIPLSPNGEISDKINKEEKIINSEAPAVSENAINEEIEVVKKEDNRISIPKQPLSMTSRTSRVGDVIVPQDELVIKSKSKGIPGWMLGVVAGIAVLIVVVMTLISQSNKKTEEEMVLSIPTQSINLPSLAEMHYGNAAFWIYIYEANYDKLNSPVNIPSNVSLLIPDLKNEYNIDVMDSMEIKRANILSEMLLKKNNNK